MQPKSSVYLVVRDNESALDTLMVFSCEQEAEIYKEAIGADAVLESEPVFDDAQQCLMWSHDFPIEAADRLIEMAEKNLGVNQ